MKPYFELLPDEAIYFSRITTFASPYFFPLGDFGSPGCSNKKRYDYKGQNNRGGRHLL